MDVGELPPQPREVETKRELEIHSESYRPEHAAILKTWKRCDFSLSSRSHKAGHPKAGRSDSRNQRFEADTGKMRKTSPQKNKGLRRSAEQKRG